MQILVLRNLFKQQLISYLAIGINHSTTLSVMSREKKYFDKL